MSGIDQIKKKAKLSIDEMYDGLNSGYPAGKTERWTDHLPVSQPEGWPEQRENGLQNDI